MTADLFLVAHKVRGEPAFDVATRMECPECPEGTDEGFCIECDNTGFWWIIPTSGHRAYPVMNWKLAELGDVTDYHSVSILREAGPLEAHPKFASVPDHYAHRAAPKVSLIEALGIRPAAPASATNFPRRV
jgi:hypothetical protein